MTRRVLAALTVTAVLAAAGAAFVWHSRRSGLPQPGSAEYEQTTRAFYSGLAALQVGLLDDATRYFTDATKLAPREPATWANLGVARLRLSDFDQADGPVQEAVRLAGDSADIQLLAGRLDIARGRLDEGIAHLRRAV